MNRTLLLFHSFVCSNISFNFVDATSKLTRRVVQNNRANILNSCSNNDGFMNNHYSTVSSCVGDNTDGERCSKSNAEMDAPLFEDLSQWFLTTEPSYATLPQDIDTENFIRHHVPNAIFSRVSPTPLKNNARLVCASRDAMSNILDLQPSVAESPDFIAFLAGQKMPAGSYPVSHRYGGHQFGFWAEQLGDGRAHLIGEYVNRLGEKWELQLKGSGPTPYSRQGDGRAVLRSSIREMIASEAMHYLGVPTTRAAALIVSDDAVVRDIFYSGRPIAERAAVVLRLSPSWFRIGSLEILSKNGETQLLKTLCDHIIKEHFPTISVEDDHRYVKFYSEVAWSSMNLVAKWMGVGFTHGVLNTDNMSVLGLTIDYGPFGFVDYYDCDYVPNRSDDGGRYSLKRQPNIVIWNMLMLATALGPILNARDTDRVAAVYNSLESFGVAEKLKIFRNKIGINGEQPNDYLLVQKLLEMMEQTVADYTMTFWQLGEVDVNMLASPEKLEDKWALKRLATHHMWSTWVEGYAKRLRKGEDSADSSTMEEERRKTMAKVNPRYVPRNWMLQDAIKAAENNDFSKVKFLMELVEKPYTINPEAEKLGYASEPPKWAHRLQLSCSS